MLGSANPLPAANESLSRPRSAGAPRGDAGKTQKAPIETAAGAASAFSFSHEEISVRYENKDGDVLEVSRSETVMRSVTLASAYTRAGGAAGKGAGRDAEMLSALLPWVPAAEGAKAGEGAQGARERGLDWARAIGDELKRQQARLLEAFLKGGDERPGPGWAHGQGGRDGRVGRAVEGTFVMVSIEVVAGRLEAGEAAAVPDYWNAENTANRIVDFATSFAGIGGADFAETITRAVAEGFRQAEGVLDGLGAPERLAGPAAKLRGETKDLVFAKLEKWLEEREAGAYNQGAQNTESEPALPVA